MTNINNAFKELKTLVDMGMDFPDAFYKASCHCNLNPSEERRLRLMYDENC